jgi:hypothetical protein
VVRSIANHHEGGAPDLPRHNRAIARMSPMSDSGWGLIGAEDTYHYSATVLSVLWPETSGRDVAYVLDLAGAVSVWVGPRYKRCARRRYTADHLSGVPACPRRAGSGRPA